MLFRSYAAHIRAVMPASSSVLMSTSECWSEGGGRGEEEEEEEERMDQWGKQWWIHKTNKFNERNNSFGAYKSKQEGLNHVTLAEVCSAAEQNNRESSKRKRAT